MNDFKKEFLAAKAAAERGDPAAMDRYGRLWAKGFPYAPEQDFDQAERWILGAQAAGWRITHLMGLDPCANKLFNESLELKFRDDYGNYLSFFSGNPSLAAD